ncbi:MAG: hypothetical protein KDC07_00030 [Chitinophagaceae bacterium]|nr:hypothetical protein [Chitinophagaceae bacterium]MCB9045099.1 hypothetical protein [Chitinophagales bacterium]
MAVSDKIQLKHPAGKNAPKISVKTYELFKTAITQILTQTPLITYSDLADKVSEYIRDNRSDFFGSVEWFTVTVKQHLESEGIIETIIENGRKMHKLV